MNRDGHLNAIKLPEEQALLKDCMRMQNFMDKFIEAPAAWLPGDGLTNITASGPPLPVLLKALEKPRDLRMGANRTEVSTMIYSVLRPVSDFMVLTTKLTQTLKIWLSHSCNCRSPFEASMKTLTCCISLIFPLLLAGCSQPERDNHDGQSTTEAIVQPPDVNTMAEPESKRPNVLLIVVDDMGYNDLSINGSEIHTPNIDSLMKEGVILDNFLVSPVCSPTRAMLLSGTDNHIAGLGTMGEAIADNVKGRPGYEGYLNFRVAVLPELFQDAGYHTYMTGKWHLGLTEETSPAARGFDRSFIMAQGGAGAFSNMLPLFGPDKAIYREDGKQLDSLPDDFYSTRFYTERMIEYIDSNRDDGKPFFAYLAYTSPHWPLQAPRESIEKYRGMYDKGYEVLKARRLQALKERGLVAEDIQPFPRFPDESAWDSLSEDEQRYQARIMEIYAAMVDDLDKYIGRIVGHLKAIGEYDNTFIFFMSDNGPEAHNLNEFWGDLEEWVADCCDNSYSNIGNANSYVWYGQNWGQAGNTPLRMYKGFTTQGGIRVPAVAHFPKGIEHHGQRTNSILHVMDVMPTLMDLADIHHPGFNYRGREVVEMKGRSMLPLLQGKTSHIHGKDEAFGWEISSKRAVRRGDWKIVYEPFNKILEPRMAGIKTDTWQLYNLANDPTEMNDLSESRPEKLRKMIAHWEEYVAETGLVIPDSWDGY